jgi:uncharacterized membrane protein
MTISVLTLCVKLKKVFTTYFKLKEELEGVFEEQMKISINRRLKELKNKKETLDTRFAFGEIDKELYHRFNDIR